MKVAAILGGWHSQPPWEDGTPTVILSGFSIAEPEKYMKVAAILEGWHSQPPWEDGTPTVILSGFSLKRPFGR